MLFKDEFSLRAPYLSEMVPWVRVNTQQTHLGQGPQWQLSCSYSCFEIVLTSYSYIITKTNWKESWRNAT